MLKTFYRVFHVYFCNLISSAYHSISQKMENKLDENQTSVLTKFYESHQGNNNVNQSSSRCVTPTVPTVLLRV